MKKLLIEAYFKPRWFEKKGLLYEWLGVQIFKQYWINGGSFWLRVFGYRLIKKYDTSGLQKFEKVTRQIELVHIVCFILYLPFIFILPMPYGLLLNLVNIYPIMSQRHSRAIIYPILQKKKKRRENL